MGYTNWIIRESDLLKIFVLEHLIFFIEKIQYGIQYLFNFYELMIKQALWDNKTTYIQILDYIFKIIKLITSIILTLHFFTFGYFSLFYLSILLDQIYSLQTSTNDFMQTRKILQRIKMFPDVDQQTLKESGDKCIMCYEEPIQAKRINCGHIFHFSCLKEYLERNSKPQCPVCKQNINEMFYYKEEKKVAKQENTTEAIELPFLGAKVGKYVGAVEWGLPVLATNKLHIPVDENKIEMMNGLIFTLLNQRENQLQ